MNKKLAVGVIILVIIASAAGYKLYLTKETGITATGTIEVTRADIMPKVNGYMSDLTIQVGDTLSAGQLVAHISRPDLKAQLLRDEAALSKAKVQLTDLEKGARSQEIQGSNANSNAAQAVFDKAQSDLERYHKLFQDGAISSQQLETIQANYEVALNSLRAAQAQNSLVQEGNRPDTIEAQRTEIQHAQAIVDASRALLDDTSVITPLTGVVLTKNYQNGEYVNPGSAIATIGDMSDCWVKVYVSSAQLGLIQLDQEVAVKVDSFPGKTFSGTIKEISQTAEFTPRQSITQSERANLVFYVKVKLSNSDGIFKPGMPADVIIK